MSIIKKSLVATIALFSLFALTACSGSTIENTSADESTIQNVSIDGKTKYPLAWTDSNSFVNDKSAASSDDASGSSIVISIINNNKEQLITLPLNSKDGYISGDIAYKEVILTNIDTEPYVVFSKSKDITIVNVYRQPYVRYNQAPISGKVVDK